MNDDKNLKDAFGVATLAAVAMIVTALASHASLIAGLALAVIIALALGWFAYCMGDR